MAATGKTPILLYGSTIATNQPSAGNLTNSSDGCEIAINVADKNLFFKDATNTVNTVPIRQSNASSDGWLSSTDWSTFNSKQPAGTYVTSVTGTAPVVSSGGTTPAISMAAATGSVNGYLTSTDWTTFNGKQAALVSGTNIKTVNGTTLLGSGDLGTIAIAYGGTNNTSFTAKSGNVAGLVFFDGTKLANDATVTDVGYDTSTNTFVASAVSVQSTSPTVTLKRTNSTAAAGSLVFSGNDDVVKWQIGSNQAIGTGFEINQGAGSNNRLYIDPSTADVKITSGNLVIGTSGKGIDFSATAGTGTSELLADYEEGTFTPVLNRDGSSPTVTYSVQLGSYVKVGNLVTVNIYLSWSAISGGTGNYTITGLPYTNANANNYLASAAIGFWNGITLRAGDTQLSAYTVPNTTIMYLVSNPTANTIVTVGVGSIGLTVSYRSA